MAHCSLKVIGRFMARKLSEMKLKFFLIKLYYFIYLLNLCFRIRKPNILIFVSVCIETEYVAVGTGDL